MQSQAEDEGRWVGGHAFLKSGLIDLPFSAPYINAALEAATASIQVAGASNDINSVGLSPSFVGQFRLGWLGVELGAQLAELGGSNAYSALVLGANFTYGLSTAARAEVYRDSTFVITPALFYSWSHGIDFSPLYAVNQAITTEGQARGSAFLINTSSHEVRPTLLSTVTVSRVLGFQAEAGLAFDLATVAGSTNDTHAALLGVAADFNLKPAFDIPFGAILAFRDAIAMSPGSTSSPLIGAGLYEMINKSFNFGVEWSRLMTNTPTLAIALSLTAYY